ncbi:sodium channel modifier 1 isoform X2 [Narcine bancroftii]|uniref:sodium channel modifier 1 isoform X2 n=1 Tax=Narcine bancroftii TaxID=1343680 RepID=UPI0038317E2D
MAFKREGDDLSQLNVLRKRRVADLLAHYIPEDEALLLNSGRYACSVCSYRPVFDTVDMLAAHRTGKKHITSLQQFYGQKRSIQLEVQKHRHRQHLQEESGSDPQREEGQLPPLLRRTREIAHHALLKASPYSSQCKRKCHSEPAGVWWQGQVGAASPVLGPAEEPLKGPAPASHPTVVHAEPAPCVKRGGRRRNTSCPPASQSVSADPDRQKLLDYHLHLRSSGWIQDPSGKWVRDAVAEFDSDEEEPPPLPPLPPVLSQCLSPRGILWPSDHQ